MLTIRQETLDHMGQAKKQEFVAQLITRLRSRFQRARELPDGGLVPVVTQLVDKAATYGLTAERHAATYVVTAWLCGADFDIRLAPAKQILTANDPAPMKSAKLAEWCQNVFGELERRQGGPARRA
jgi:hypothetical protein